MRFRAAATCRTCLRWRRASRRPSPMSAAARWRSARTCPATACLSQPKLQVEGMNITMGADQNTAIYFNDSTLEEVQIRTSGNDAEVSVPGISMVAIMKSGGNDFHGTYQVSTESPRLQADNLNDALRAQGLTATSPLKNFYDLSADLGGQTRPRQAVVLRRVRAAGKERGPARVRVRSGPRRQVPDGRRPARQRRDVALADVREVVLPAHEEQSSRLRVAARHQGAAAEQRRPVHPARIDEGLQESDRDSEDRAPEHDQSARARERRGRLQRLRDRLRCGPLVRACRCAAAAGSRDDVEYRLGAAASEQDARSLPDRRQRQFLPASARSPASTSSRPASASISTRAPTVTRTTWPATASCTPIRSAVSRIRRRKSGSTTRRSFPPTTTTSTRGT